ncbi:MAG: HAD family hydrolase [Planctomycetota bacterium]|nr:MAG: HAD family hydrolase [Planctomycetota bacterium]
MNLAQRPAWIFDMDGTLTVAIHDFEQIRRDLGVPSGQPILEYLDRLPADRAAPLRRRLGRVEETLAARAEPMPGAASLLTRLRREGCRLGVLTRNRKDCALTTLATCGLLRFFEQDEVVGREEAPAKPEPDGLLMLLDTWKLPSSAAVMIGNYLFDLQAGHAAGARTVYVDPSGDFPYRDHADDQVRDLRELQALVWPEKAE